MLWSACVLAVLCCHAAHAAAPTLRAGGVHARAAGDGGHGDVLVTEEAWAGDVARGLLHNTGTHTWRCVIW